MAKDSYWFRHDSTAGRGSKLLMIQKIYGHWGKGVYWDVVEVLREQDDYKFDKSDTSLGLLSDLIRADEMRFKSWYLDCVRIGLFSEDETHFFSEVLTENMQVWERQKTNGSQGGRPKKTTGLNPTLKPTPFKKSKPTHKTIIEDNRIKEKIIRNKILFKDSPFFNKKTFKDALPDWSSEKLKYYYESALSWSNEGNKKIDWVATVRNWASRDEKEGKLKFKSDTNKHYMPLQGTIN